MLGKRLQYTAVFSIKKSTVPSTLQSQKMSNELFWSLQRQTDAKKRQWSWEQCWNSWNFQITFNENPIGSKVTQPQQWRKKKGEYNSYAKEAENLPYPPLAARHDGKDKRYTVSKISVGLYHHKILRWIVTEVTILFLKNKIPLGLTYCLIIKWIFIIPSTVICKSKAITATSRGGP